MAEIIYMDYVPWSAAEEIYPAPEEDNQDPQPYLETAEIDEERFNAALHAVLGKQVVKVLVEDAYRMDESWKESCLERIRAEENRETAWEMSPQKPNVSSVHNVEVTPQLPLCTHSLMSEDVAEHGQSMAVKVLVEDAYRMGESWIESCLERIRAEENRETAWEMSPQKPNVSSVHNVEVTPQLPLCIHSLMSEDVAEHRQSMIGHSMLNPDTSEFIPRGRTVIANF